MDFFCSLFYALFATVFATIPSYMKICHRNDPDINRCIIKSVEQLREKLIKGIPELEIPSIEPLLLKRIQVFSGPTNGGLDVNLTNVEVFGVSKFVIRNLYVDIENLIFNCNITMEKLEVQGKYDIKTQIVLLQTTGSGDFTGRLDDYECDLKMKAHKIHKNNETYIGFEKIKVNTNLHKVKYNFINLFNGHLVLAPAISNLINSNLFFIETKPLLESSLSDFFTEISNKVIQKFTYDELFPDN